MNRLLLAQQFSQEFRILPNLGDYMGHCGYSNMEQLRHEVMGAVLDLDLVHDIHDLGNAQCGVPSFTIFAIGKFSGFFKIVIYRFQASQLSRIISMESKQPQPVTFR